jgi:hypothetical protein
MTERRHHLTAGFLILRSLAVILRRRISDDGATPPNDGGISGMAERLRHLTAGFLILRSPAVILGRRL